MKINIKKRFNDDYISREAGEKLRLTISPALKMGEKVELDFESLMIASTSFFDEGIAKLIHENIPDKKIQSLLCIKNIHPRDLDVLQKMTRIRGWEFQMI